MERLKAMNNAQHLSPQDLLATFVACRVLPLQRMENKIIHMSSRLDPTQTSKHELEPTDIVRGVNNISNARISDIWRWGMESFCRANIPPQVRSTPLGGFTSLFFISFSLSLRFSCRPQLFTRQIVKDNPLESKDWVTKCAESEGKGNQGAKDDEESEECTGTNNAASFHLLRDWDDDEDEDMVIESIDELTLSMVPPAANHVPGDKNRKGVGAGHGATTDRLTKKPTCRRKAAGPKTVLEASG
jgi:hypothetical protein